MSKVVMTLDAIKEAIKKFHAEQGTCPKSGLEDASSYLGLPDGTFTWNALNARIRRDETSLTKLALELGLSEPKEPKPTKEPKAKKVPEPTVPEPTVPDRPLDGKVTLTFKTLQEWEQLRRLLGIPTPAEQGDTLELVFTAQEITAQEIIAFQP